jgi:anaerobic selenocysteine-containing dehydrogenase
LAAKNDMWLNEQGRLTEPMVKRPGSDHYEPISWDGALDLLAAELSGLDSPDEALFYTSCRLSNEAAFLLQLFARVYGTLVHSDSAASIALCARPYGLKL